MSAARDIYVLDTSAWLTLIEDEAGADSVEELIAQARAGEIVVLVSFMSFMEVYYITILPCRNGIGMRPKRAWI